MANYFVKSKRPPAKTINRANGVSDGKPLPPPKEEPKEKPKK